MGKRRNGKEKPQVRCCCRQSGKMMVTTRPGEVKERITVRGGNGEWSEQSRLLGDCERCGDVDEKEDEERYRLCDNYHSGYGYGYGGDRERYNSTGTSGSRSRSRSMSRAGSRLGDSTLLPSTPSIPSTITAFPTSSINTISNVNIVQLGSHSGGVSTATSLSPSSSASSGSYLSASPSRPRPQSKSPPTSNSSRQFKSSKSSSSKSSKSIQQATMAIRDDSENISDSSSDTGSSISASSVGARYAPSAVSVTSTSTSTSSKTPRTPKSSQSSKSSGSTNSRVHNSAKSKTSASTPTSTSIPGRDSAWSLVYYADNDDDDDGTGDNDYATIKTRSTLTPSSKGWSNTPAPSQLLSVNHHHRHQDGGVAVVASISNPRGGGRGFDEDVGEMEMRILGEDDGWSLGGCSLSSTDRKTMKKTKKSKSKKKKSTIITTSQPSTQSESKPSLSTATARPTSLPTSAITRHEPTRPSFRRTVAWTDTETESMASSSSEDDFTLSGVSFSSLYSSSSSALYSSSSLTFSSSSEFDDDYCHTKNHFRAQGRERQSVTMRPQLVRSWDEKTRKEMEGERRQDEELERLMRVGGDVD
ncbi:hypothetical protein EX30DRAFT_142637 [Ascodesmis nigricans]|uniref:Uncharacterized protein n=1 Tax=Ascodesmis nigricans TaxID=341454 RepID=A0A4S2N1I6_9PEZI|nr:hypothetical protein EX30DRAFT_142637 [Ascodesmis nigricans]